MNILRKWGMCSQPNNLYVLSAYRLRPAKGLLGWAVRVSGVTFTFRCNTEYARRSQIVAQPEQIDIRHGLWYRAQVGLDACPTGVHRRSNHTGQPARRRVLYQGQQAIVPAWRQSQAHRDYDAAV